MTEKRTTPCQGCGWRYAGPLARSKASDHARGCPIYARMIENREKEKA